MDEQQMIDELMGAANGNLHVALALAVRQIAMAGACISAGFVRCNPYSVPPTSSETAGKRVAQYMSQDRRAAG